MPPKDIDDVTEDIHDLALVVAEQGIKIGQLEKQFPELNASICQDREEAKITREMVIAMPGKIVEAIEAKNRGGRFEINQWLILLVSAFVLLLALPAACQSVQSIIKPQAVGSSQ